MKEIKAGLSEAEREALRALWDHGPGTVRQIMELLAGRGRLWVYSTVATLLRRLEGNVHGSLPRVVIRHRVPVSMETSSVTRSMMERMPEVPQPPVHPCPQRRARTMPARAASPMALACLGSTAER